MNPVSLYFATSTSMAPSNSMDVDLSIPANDAVDAVPTQLLSPTQLALTPYIDLEVISFQITPLLKKYIHNQEA
jgi:hypothetical protein